MVPNASAPPGHYSLYSTELRIIDQTLSSILLMAQNIFLPEVSKKLSAFWVSNHCSEGRKAIFQAHFFTKLNIGQNSIPSFIREKLTPEKVQTLLHPTTFNELYPEFDILLPQDYQGCLGLYKAMQNTDDIEPQLDIMVDGIYRCENTKDWVSSYFLAHVLGTSRLSESLYRYDPTSGTSYTRHFLPFSSWLILLQRPEITDHLLVIFKKNLASLGLDLERKIHCATSIINVYHRPDVNNAIRRQCLSILLQISQVRGGRPEGRLEGRQALLEANGLIFLINTIKATNHNFMSEDLHNHAKYILANLIQDNKVLQTILDNEPSILETILKDLDWGELCYGPDSINYLLNLLNVVVSLPPTNKAGQMIVIEHALFSIEKIRYWLEGIAASEKDTTLRRLIMIENDIKLLGKTLKKRYSPILAEIIEDPNEPELYPPKVCNAPPILSKSCDACCRID